MSEDLTLNPGLAPELDRGRPAVKLPESDGLDQHTRRTLLQQERAIAKKYSSATRAMWPYTVVTLGCFALWLAFWPLAMMDIMPLWIGFVASTVFAAGGYITSHEAMHSNIGRSGSRTRFWNEAVGQVATIILIFPFSMARMMHLHHHYYTNDPEKDPDYTDTAKGKWHAWYKTWLNRQPGADGSIHHYKRVLERIGTPAAKAALRDTMLLQLGSMAFFFAMSWAGYALEVALLWWLPRHLGLSYIRYWLSWAPHHPRTGTGRYDNTRIFRTWIGHYLSMGMQYHMVHHLYPEVPNHLTRYAYREMKPILEARGVDCSALKD